MTILSANFNGFCSIRINQMKQGERRCTPKNDEGL
jgi:hypothetical protein